MTEQKFSISQVTLAVTNSIEMAIFYSKVFNLQLNEFEAMGSKFYSGKIAGLNLLFCPNSIAGVEAKQNRHQFDYTVTDLESIVKIALNSGGTLHGKIEENDVQKSATIIDPENNTMNFIQSK